METQRDLPTSKHVRFTHALVSSYRMKNVFYFFFFFVNVSFLVDAFKESFDFGVDERTTNLLLTLNVRYYKICIIHCWYRTLILFESKSYYTFLFGYPSLPGKSGQIEFLVSYTNLIVRFLQVLCSRIFALTSNLFHIRCQCVILWQTNGNELGRQLHLRFPPDCQIKQRIVNHIYLSRIQNFSLESVYLPVCLVIRHSVRMLTLIGILT